MNYLTYMLQYYCASPHFFLVLSYGYFVSLARGRKLLNLSEFRKDIAVLCTREHQIFSVVACLRHYMKERALIHPNSVVIAAVILSPYPTEGKKAYLILREGGGEDYRQPTFRQLLPTQYHILANIALPREQKVTKFALPREQ